MNMPTLPRKDNYWKREDNEIIGNALIVVVSLILGAVIIAITLWGKK